MRGGRGGAHRRRRARAGPQRRAGFWARRVSSEPPGEADPRRAQYGISIPAPRPLPRTPQGRARRCWARAGGRAGRQAPGMQTPSRSDARAVRGSQEPEPQGKAVPGRAVRRARFIPWPGLGLSRPRFLRPDAGRSSVHPGGAWRGWSRGQVFTAARTCPWRGTTGSGPRVRACDSLAWPL